MKDYHIEEIIRITKDILVGKRGNFTDALFALADAIKYLGESSNPILIKDYEHKED